MLITTVDANLYLTSQQLKHAAQALQSLKNQSDLKRLDLPSTLLVNMDDSLKRLEASLSAIKVEYLFREMRQPLSQE